jgi:hypothetical protein
LKATYMFVKYPTFHEAFFLLLSCHYVIIHLITLATYLRTLFLPTASHFPGELEVQRDLCGTRNIKLQT